MNTRGRLATAALTIATLFVGMAALSPPSSAVDWTRTASQTLKAYSWNGYKATIRPHRASIPQGTVLVGRTITVKRDGLVLARDRSSFRARVGTYSVYTKTKYRSRTAYTAYRTVEMPFVTDIYSCTVTGESVEYSFDDSILWTDYQLACTGAGENWDFESVTGRGTASMTVYDDDPYNAGQTVYPEYADVLENDDWTYRESYTAYRYGTVKTKYTFRTVRVVKVANTAVMTYLEYKQFGRGSTLADVRRYAGSPGSLYEATGQYQLFRWRNSAGGYTYVWFDWNNYWIDDVWRS